MCWQHGGATAEETGGEERWDRGEGARHEAEAAGLGVLEQPKEVTVATDKHKHWFRGSRRRHLPLYLLGEPCMTRPVILCSQIALFLYHICNELFIVNDDDVNITTISLLNKISVSIWIHAFFVRYVFHRSVYLPTLCCLLYVYFNWRVSSMFYYFG